MRSMRRGATRTYPRRGRRTTIKRQAFGNFASALQQRDSTNVVVSSVEDVVINVPADCNEGTVVRNVNALLCDTTYFQNYMGMYDQYKINAVRANIEMIRIDNSLLNPATFPSVCTSWDRNGIKLDSVDARVAGDPNPLYRYKLPEYQVVTSYSSANEKTIYYGSRWGVIRQLDAASMMEKSIYLPTANTRDVLSHGNLYAAWNPMLLISIHSPTVMPAGGANCIVNIHWQFDVTLRGLRKIPVANVAAFQPFAGFVGYARNNYGYAIVKQSGLLTGQFAVAGDAANNYPQPSINPEVNPNAPAGPNRNGLIVPNEGTADQNLGI